MSTESSQESPEFVFEGSHLDAHAFYVGEDIDLRVVPDRLAFSPLLARVGEAGWVAVFRYGVLVFFNVESAERSSFVSRLRPDVSEPFASPEREARSIRVDPKAMRDGIHDSGDIVVSLLTVGRLQLIADCLAKSVVLAQYEQEMANVFRDLQPLASDLVQGHGGRSNLLEHIGGSLLIQQRMVGRVEVSEKPELLWERPELELLYVRLAEDYELLQRHAALERKLGLIKDTATTALGLMQHRRSLRVEWYIVFLIVIEIGLSLYELFSH